MKVDYSEEPFRQLPLRLRDWLEQTIQQAETDDSFPFWRAALPAGSSMDDAIIASECIIGLFAARLWQDDHTPVDVEFAL